MSSEQYSFIDPQLEFKHYFHFWKYEDLNCISVQSHTLEDVYCSGWNYKIIDGKINWNASAAHNNISAVAKKYMEKHLKLLIFE
jgi:hypothetical protein